MGSKASLIARAAAMCSGSFRSNDRSVALISNPPSAVRSVNTSGVGVIRAALRAER